jgi:hypothetical protein
LHYVPFTRICVTTIFNPVAGSTQIALLSSSKTGMPLAVTRVAAVIQVQVTHGPLAAMGGGKAQPATV